MPKGKSTVGAKIVYKNSKDGLNLDGIYRLLIINPTTFALNVNDQNFGTIPVAANSTVPIDGHPDYPFDVSITFVFNELAPGTDNITVIYIRIIEE